MDAQRVKAGEVVGCYKVVDPRGFAGVLPTAVILPGNRNAGIQVILTSWKRPS